MPLPQSDLVQESKLKTIFSSNSTKHFFYERGTSNRDRKIQLKEKWKQRRFLGQGAYGTVWLETCDQPARDNGPRVRAVKRIPIDIMLSEEIDYSRELEAVIKFSQPSYTPSFVRSFGWFESPEAIFIAMEYVENGDLQKYLAQPISEHETKIIVWQLAEGLQHMHRNGFTHRDLKPGNILVVSKGPDWLVQISDFGISRRLQHEQGTLGTIQKGTFGFMAPEMLGLVNERDRPHAADIWSLGAILFRMLTKCLFLDLNTLPRYAGGEETFPMDKLDSISASDPLKELLQKLLAPSPRSRPSAAEILNHEWIRKVAGDNQEIPNDDNSSTSNESASTTLSIEYETEDGGNPSAAWSTLKRGETVEKSTLSSDMQPGTVKRVIKKLEAGTGDTAEDKTEVPKRRLTTQPDADEDDGNITKTRFKKPSIPTQDQPTSKPLDVPETRRREIQTAEEQATHDGCAEERQRARKKTDGRETRLGAEQKPTPSFDSSKDEVRRVRSNKRDSLRSTNPMLQGPGSVRSITGTAVTPDDQQPLKAEAAATFRSSTSAYEAFRITLSPPSDMEVPPPLPPRPRDLVDSSSTVLGKPALLSSDEEDASTCAILVPRLWRERDSASCSHNWVPDKRVPGGRKSLVDKIDAWNLLFPFDDLLEVHLNAVRKSRENWRRARAAMSGTESWPSKRRQRLLLATTDDAMAAGIPRGFNFDEWEPGMYPILFQGSAFDITSIALWFLGWAWHYGPANVWSFEAELFAYRLRALDSKLSVMEERECLSTTGRHSELCSSLIDHTDALLARLQTLLKWCEDLLSSRAAEVPQNDTLPRDVMLLLFPRDISEQSSRWFSAPDQDAQDGNRDEVALKKATMELNSAIYHWEVSVILFEEQLKDDQTPETPSSVVLESES